MEQNQSKSPEHVTVVPADFYEKMVASLDKQTEISQALAEAARRQRKLIRNK